MIILCGVLFMAMPITIVGNSFAQVWEEKEAIKVVLKMQGEPYFNLDTSEGR